MNNEVLTGPIHIEVGDIQNQSRDFKGTAFYVPGSETYFSYYILNGTKHLVTNDVSLNIEIAPSKIKEIFSENVDFSISFSCVGRTTIVGSDLFTSSSILKAPRRIKFLYEPNFDSFYSDNVEVAVADIGSGRSQYNITCKSTLFDPYEPSISDYFSYYANGNTVSLKTMFEFEIANEERAITILNQLTNVEFYTDLPEKES